MAKILDFILPKKIKDLEQQINWDIMVVGFTDNEKFNLLRSLLNEKYWRKEIQAHEWLGRNTQRRRNQFYKPPSSQNPKV